jgi:uncharacterized protein (DUF433 family)
MMRYNEDKTYKVIFGLIPMSDLLAKITINSKQCGGRPCIRGMRIRVSDVLDLFVAGLIYASRQLNHPVLVA